jgi:hypothetical protein
MNRQNQTKEKNGLSVRVPLSIAVRANLPALFPPLGCNFSPLDHIHNLIGEEESKFTEKLVFSHERKKGQNMDLQIEQPEKLPVCFGCVPGYLLICRLLSLAKNNQANSLINRLGMALYEIRCFDAWEVGGHDLNRLKDKVI